MKTYNSIVLEVAKREGKKKSQDIAQIKETVSILCDVMFEFGGTTEVLLANGKKRADRKAK